MITLDTAENALKGVYLDVLAEQIKISTNPLYSMIKHTSKDIFGKEVVKAAPFGLSGGFSASGETDALPVAGDKGYVQFRSTLKNLYGKFEISDKAVRASANNIGSFVNLLQDEMESLVKSCAFNLNRMMYGTGSGLLAKVTAVASGVCTCDNINKLMEGMYVDAYTTAGKQNAVPYRILSVDRVNKTFTYNKGSNTRDIAANDQLYVQSSKDNEITGLDALWTGTTLYGVEKSNNAWLKAYNKTLSGEISDIAIQEVLDYLEEYADSRVNFISTSSKVRRAYQQYLNIYRKNVDIADIGNGFKAITHNGIPIFADKFAPETSMYFLNTEDFTMHELCDWQWMQDEGGRVLKQNPGFPTYTGTLVKYAELFCDKPMGQARLDSISLTVDDPYKTYIPTVSE